MLIVCQTWIVRRETLDLKDCVVLFTNTYSFAYL